jgi:hypothetical protein
MLDPPKSQRRPLLAPVPALVHEDYRAGRPYPVELLADEIAIMRGGLAGSAGEDEQGAFVAVDAAAAGGRRR